ncbi:MAG: helix-turn-helix domain-containing protein [Acidobacteria bacterium]|nr:helix-turn-helix domain-containing protein [Acidobacteriota bacterium]
MEKSILLADEVAEMLRVDRQRVYELVRRKAIPVIRLGERQYRFDAEAIRQWMTRGGGTAEGKGRDESEERLMSGE